MYLAARKPSLAQGVDLIATAAGGVARLRKLILSLAVRGALSRQRLSDESAERLLIHLSQRRREKANSSRAKADPTASDFLIHVTGFALPAGWAWASLSELGSFASGKTPSTGRADYWDGNIPWVTPKDMKATRIAGSEDHVSEKAIADGLVIVPESAVLIVVRSGILRRMVPVAITTMRCTVNQDLKALTLFEPSMAAYVQLMIAGFESFILSNLTKIGTTVESIKFDEFAACHFPIPPLAEQHRIVARVEELMKLCDALVQSGRLADEQHARLTSTLFDALAASESAHALAENWQRIADHFDLLLDRPEAIDALEQTIFQLAVRGLLVPQSARDEPASALREQIRREKDDLVRAGAVRRDRPLPDIGRDCEPFELPTSWEWVKLNEIAIQITDGAHHTPTYVPVGVPFLSVKNLSSGYLDFSDTRFITEAAHAELSRRCKPELGDLLLTKIGTTGIAVVVNDRRPFSIFVSVALIKLPARLLDREYLSLVINSPFVRKQSQDGTEGVGNKNLVLRKIAAFSIPLPPFAEQHRIVARVEELRRLCAQLRERLTHARQTQANLADALVARAAEA